MTAAEVDVSKLPPAAASYDFAKDIQPLLENACVKCHGPEKKKGSFRIDTREDLLKGGDEGKAIVEGDSAKSPLIHYVAHLISDLEMPPKGKGDKLTPTQIGLLRAWIDKGAKWPDGVRLSAPKETADKKTKSLADLPPAVKKKVDFVKDVQPIFASACYSCHGPRKQEANYRLDHKATAMRGREHGAPIVPGKSAESRLIHLVAAISEEVMPQKGERLTAEQVGILRAWIDQGAKWPDSASVVLKDKTDHWAFKPPVKEKLPKPKLKAWQKNPIDAFIASRLEKEGLQPSPQADKATLLRRLSLDLIGLPPTPQELDAFLADTSSGAYEKQVERLLASPHYGERWGRIWLDAARYADSDGFEKDKPRMAWHYRDWVIGAINRDLPYDQFIIEQLAGDQLPNASQDQIIATGFLRNSMINEEGGVDPEQFRMEAMFDRMEAIGKGVLGLTIQCAQCHTHKYDPITQEEYYRMFAFLNNDHEAQPVVYTAEELQKRAEILRQTTEIETMMRQQMPEWQSRMAKWEDEWRARPQIKWTVIQPIVEDISTGGQRYLPQKDGSFIAAGYQPTKHEVKLQLKTDINNITAFRIEMMNDPNLPAGGPGRSHLGSFGLSEFKVEAGPINNPSVHPAVKFVKATADLEPPPETTINPLFNEKKPVRRVIGPASYAIDGKEDSAWSNDIGPGRRNRECTAVFAAEKPISHEGGTNLIIKLSQKHGGWNSDDLHANNLGRFRISVTDAPNAEADPVPPHVRSIFAIPREQRTPAQVATVFSHWRTTMSEFKELNARLDELWKGHPEGATQLALQTRETMRDTFLLKRGDWLKPGKAVNAGVPAILNPLPSDAPPTRLTFARWLVDPKAPTTARSLVNRVWQAYFGTGIVSTSEDFGTQCDAPSHKELLDYLACEFMENGWSLKKFHRLIVSSETYKQSSKITPDLYAKDQFNRLLARGPRFRVDGEIVRDIGLSVSGLLNPKLGGRSVMPPAPAFLFLPPASYAPFPWVEETGAERYRRAVYTYRRRSTPYPMLQTFDVPEGNTSCVRRTRANTPLQALTTLNEGIFVDCARALAKTILQEGGGSDAERIAYGFKRTLSRPPTAEETKTLTALLEKQRARIAEGKINANELATGKNEPPAELPKGADAAQLAAYTVVARVMLNLDETITKE
ncbi:MAG TPA: PSD1 and planctomycete cytochrome C domain-containing protein [Planctomycetota bacterium]|nr:PSD1 and planctomycete cytochrome C domain-containing protein [Planctomycetota bacterium]